jgi:hypothetical protein
MKFFLDENFPKAARGLLLSLGHECFDPRGTDLEGVSDSILLKEAWQMGGCHIDDRPGFFPYSGLPIP